MLVKKHKMALRRNSNVLLSGVATAGLFGSRYAPQIQEAFEKKFSKLQILKKRLMI